MKPYDNPLWDFSDGGRKDKKKKVKIPKIVAYLSLLRWSHALRSDQDSDIELDQWKTGWLKKRKDLGTDHFETEIEKRFRKRLRLSYHDEETILEERSTNHPVDNTSDTTPDEEKVPCCKVARHPINKPKMRRERKEKGEKRRKKN